MDNRIIELLFKTNAIQACPEGEPFFYTSGKIGPYYINTHYLYGSKNMADEYLYAIENFKKEIKSFSKNIFKLSYKQYISNEIYKDVIDMICDKADEYDIDYISGGERRDFFFSLLPASLLDKPHISILKDKTAIISTSDFNNSHIAKPDELSGMKVLHIADLVTEASSYERAWIPALENLGLKFENSISVVDRNQGGREILKEKNISLYAFASIDKQLFTKALKEKYISERQYEMISLFIDDPDRFMLEFLDKNPEFLNEKINMGGKIKERALLCKEMYLRNKEE